MKKQNDKKNKKFRVSTKLETTKVKNKKNNKKDNKKMKKILTVAGGAVLVSVGFLTSDTFKAKEIDYLKFQTLVSEKKVKEIKFKEGSSTLIIVDKNENLFKTVNPDYETFRAEHLSQGIKFTEKKSIPIATILSLGISFALLSSLSKSFNMGNDSKMLDENNIPKERFKDISGLKEVKEELSLLVEYLNNPKKFTEFGAKMQTGTVLYGPPGTGKTLVAKALAGEAGVPFFNISGSDFVEMFAGLGAKKVRNLFKEARKNAPCIIFIDEIDAIGKKRSKGGGDGATNERDQTVNQFLVEMDGFKDNEGILLMCATNNLESLDDALIRPGRFGNHVRVPLPRNKEERLDILKIHASNKKIESETLEYIASATTSFSGADLSNILNQSAIIQIMDNKDVIDNNIAEKALFRIITKGSRIKRSESQEEENRIVAWHEAGHALASKIAGQKVVQATIISSSSGIGGFVQHARNNERTLLKLSELRTDVKICYSGRIAESFILKDDITLGASNDIEKASETINDMIRYYGMNSSKTLLDFDIIENKKKILEDAEKLANELYEEALSDMYKHRCTLEALANALLEKETLYESDIDEIFERNNTKKELAIGLTMDDKEASAS